MSPRTARSPARAWSSTWSTRCFYFEGERGHQFRILRAVKNRFGPDRRDRRFRNAHLRLASARQSSALFLSGGGSGLRRGRVCRHGRLAPVLAEVQALVAPSGYGTPRRSVVGWDSNRLAMLLAVLEARCGLGFGGRDVYLNVAGGLKIGEPAADLAVAAALISSYLDAPLPSDGVAFGEVALSGDVRPAGRSDARLKEAAKLGFKRALAPPASRAQASRSTGWIRSRRWCAGSARTPNETPGKGLRSWKGWPVSISSPWRCCSYPV